MIIGGTVEVRSWYFLKKIKGCCIMNGPFQRGTYRRFRNTFRHLCPNKSYRVINSFIDYDNHLHATGEEWIFKGAYYIEQEDGISLFIEIGESEWNIPLKWSRGYQLDVIDNLEHYVAPVQLSDKRPARLLHPAGEDAAGESRSKDLRSGLSAGQA